MPRFKQYTDTKCRLFFPEEMTIESRPEDGMQVFKAILPDGTVLQNNFGEYYKTFSLDQTLSYFLMDENDTAEMETIYAECENEEEKKQKTIEYLGSVNRFTSFFKKKIYVRLIQSTPSHEEPHVFVDEVSEIIPIVLKQQNTPVQEKDFRLIGYRSSWTKIFPHVYRTIPLSEFEKVLDDFDIDKTLITLVADPSQEVTHREHVDLGGQTRFYSQDLQIVTSVHHAINLAFESLVMPVNWRSGKCGVHDSCVANLKREIMETFNYFYWVGENGCITAQSQISVIENTKEMCAETFLEERELPDYLMNGHAAEDDVTINHYYLVTDTFNLERFTPTIKPPGEGRIYIWMLRLLVKLGQIQQFFAGVDDRRIEDVMMEAVYFVVPSKYLTAAQELVHSIVREWLRNHGVIVIPPVPGEEKQGPLSTEDAAMKMLAARLKRDVVLAKKKEEAKKKKKGGKK